MAFVSSFVPSFTSSSSKLVSPVNKQHVSVSSTQRQQARFNMSLSEFDQLSQYTTIVEDTGDIEQIAEHKPHSATTNPSLVAAAAKDERYKHLIDEAIIYGKQKGTDRVNQLNLTRDKLFTLFGVEILSNLGSSDGDVSTEVDARLSFDVEAQLQVSRRIIEMYEEKNISKDRILIKLASTWEGLEACKILQQEGIKTNMTLLFHKSQAIVAAQNDAFLISPFVGRILDWFKKEDIDFEQDPGVVSVKEIYQLYKCMGFDTIVMGASFRNKQEILDLAGCDRLTIAPKFISDMKVSTGSVVNRVLDIPTEDQCKLLNIDEVRDIDEKKFRWMMNQDAMATEKLAHGIRGFAADLNKLDDQLQSLIDA